MPHSHSIVSWSVLALLTIALSACPGNNGGAGAGAGGGGGGTGGLSGSVIYQHESAGTGLDIYRLDPATGTESAVYAGPGDDEWPTVDVTSGTLAFVSNESGNTEIYSMPLTGGTPVNLSDDPGMDQTPDWSSDGRIAFATNRDGDFDIWSMSANGGNKRPVWQGARNENTCVDTEPAWSPDNSRIAFTSDCDGNGFAIWVGLTDPQNPTRTRIAADGNRNLVDPSWTPDGSKIVAESCSQSNTADCDIVIMNADGSNLRNLTTTPNIGEVDPVVTRDGTQVVVGFFPAGGTGIQIARIPIGGGAATVMTPQASHGRGPEHIP